MNTGTCDNPQRTFFRPQTINCMKHLMELHIEVELEGLAPLFVFSPVEALAVSKILHTPPAVA